MIPDTNTPVPLPADSEPPLAEALLLCCKDYRMVGPIARYMKARGLEGNYNQIGMAGASLGIVREDRPHWGQLFWEHVGFSLQLHRIRRVIVIDHRDCGAYRLMLNVDLKDDPEQETELHARHLRLLGQQIRARHPDLQVELLLMALDGSVTEIPA